jgi:D-alanyl-D-alanine carboxypeptidase/D-alanyl-D-alanine-endopeptidase (penicillin-binding protein 4)
MSPRLRSIPAVVLPVILGLAGVAALPHASAVAASPKGRLAERVAAELRHDGARNLGYTVNDSAYGGFGAHSGRAFTPASNQKLFTAITLLSRVGSNFRYETRVAATARQRSGVVDGNLVVHGSGDPTLTRTDLASMAQRLHKHGLKRVTGHLVIDDTRYSHKTRVSGWKADFVPDESGPVDAFSVDHDAWKRNARFLADPSHANGTLFRRALRRAHIKIQRRIEVGRSPRVRQGLVSHRSPTLAAIVDPMLTDSINFDAEMMLREAGAQRSGHGSPKTGVAAERALAAKLGVPFGVAHDGSGLSYTDRSTPATLVAWLLRLRSLPIFSTVYYALPLSCETGTLEHRLCGPSVRGQVRAKTGTLTHISTLSGYVNSESGHTITFSFMASGVRNFGKLYTKVDGAIALLRRRG